MNPYYELGKKSTIANELLEFALRPEQWRYYDEFKARQVPHEILIKDEFIKYLLSKYKFTAGIIKIDPYHCYDWHKDGQRGVGINMILTPDIRSFCMFTDKRDESWKMYKITELIYKPMTYYLFNTQVYHTVYNFEDTRYLFSIIFDGQKDDLTYDQLLKDVITNYE
jgi:hypothetical protein